MDRAKTLLALLLVGCGASEEGRGSVLLPALPDDVDVSNAQSHVTFDDELSAPSGAPLRLNISQQLDGRALQTFSYETALRGQTLTISISPFSEGMGEALIPEQARLTLGRDGSLWDGVQGAVEARSLDGVWSLSLRDVLLVENSLAENRQRNTLGPKNGEVTGELERVCFARVVDQTARSRRTGAMTANTRLELDQGWSSDFCSELE